MPGMTQLHRADRWIPTNTFALRLRWLRHDLGGISVEDIAEACGFSASTWSTWERGASPRDKDVVVAKIAAVTNVDRDWLMWGTESTKTRHQRAA